jgi:hypothetical protein
MQHRIGGLAISNGGDTGAATVASEGRTHSRR